MLINKLLKVPTKAYTCCSYQYRSSQRQLKGAKRRPPPFPRVFGLSPLRRPLSKTAHGLSQRTASWRCESKKLLCETSFKNCKLPLSQRRFTGTDKSLCNAWFVRPAWHFTPMWSSAPLFKDHLWSNSPKSGAKGDRERTFNVPPKKEKGATKSAIPPLRCTLAPRDAKYKAYS